MTAGIIGLGSMGLGMARSMLSAGIPVKGFDVSEGPRSKLKDSGGIPTTSVAEAARDVDPLVVMVENAAQAEDVLFRAGNAVASMQSGSTVLLCSTIAPSEAVAIGKRVAAAGCHMLDAPVSGGKVGADNGSLTVMASGNDAAMQTCEDVLAAISKTVHRVGNEPGKGATYKVVHQLAAGVHLVASAEVMALGVRTGCDPKILFDIVSTSAGQSWMFNDRVPHMLDGDFEARSMVDIFIKDLNLVLQTGREVSTPLPLSAAAHQMLLAASALGYGQLDDSAVVKAYETLTGHPIKPSTERTD